MTAHILIAALEVAHEHVVEAKNYFVPFIDFNTQILTLIKENVTILALIMVI